MGKRLMAILVLSMAVSGCATFRGEQPMIAQLQMRVGELERAVQAKDQRITELEYDVKDLTYNVQQFKGSSKNSRKVYKPTTTPARQAITASDDKEQIIRVNADPADVQQALKSAGYYSGNIDGKIGPATKKSIYQFQKDYHLKADGLVGQQTWAELQNFVN